MLSRANFLLNPSRLILWNLSVEVANYIKPFICKFFNGIKCHIETFFIRDLSEKYAAQSITTYIALSLRRCNTLARIWIYFNVI